MGDAGGLDAPRPFVSFLTTAYRTEAYLPATIASVRAQTDDDWELVVVDNGNAEPIAAIVRAVAADDDRVRLVRQENRGYVGGLTAAAEVARGEFVTPLDSDDHLTPDFVATMREIVRLHPTADVVGSDAHQFSVDGEPGGHRDHRRSYLQSVAIPVPAREGERLRLEDLLAGHVPYYGALFRRTAWDAVGGYAPGPDTEGPVDESVDIWLRLVEDHELWVTGARLARYRVRSDSLSRDPKSVAAFEDALVGSFLGHARRRPEDADLVDRTVRRLRYHQALGRARRHFADGDVRAARVEARRALAARRTPRSLVVVVLLRTAPGLLTRIHPVKQRLGAWSSRTGASSLRPTTPTTPTTQAAPVRSAPAPRPGPAAEVPRGR